MNNSWICVDANLVIRLMVDPEDTVVRQLWETWDRPGYQIVAPALLYFEVSNALYQYQKRRLLSHSAVNLALDAALSLPIQLYHEPDLHRQALSLAKRLSLSATYDAHYLALAQYLRAEFWTADRRLVNAIQETFPWVRLAA